MRWTEWVWVVAAVLFALAGVATIFSRDWLALTRSVAMIAMVGALLMTRRAGAHGGQLPRWALVLILVPSVATLGLLPLAISSAADRLDLVLTAIMLVGAATVVIAVLVGSRRRALGVPRDRSSPHPRRPA